jgi:hypothetical protein
MLASIMASHTTRAKRQQELRNLKCEEQTHLRSLGYEGEILRFFQVGKTLHTSLSILHIHMRIPESSVCGFHQQVII